MDKWLGLSIITVISTFCIVVTVPSISTDNSNIELAKSGLEQCPIEVGSGRVIWVKDCTKYLNKIEELKGK